MRIHNWLNITKLNMNSESFGVIYCVINIMNNKKYIGQTTRSFEKRKQEHLASYPSKKNCALHLAIKKYGEQNFIWQIIDTADTLKELNEKEKHYIKQYNTYNCNGYNSTTGGQDKGRNCKGKAIKLYDIDGNFIIETRSEVEICYLLDVTIGSLSKVLTGNRPTVKECIVIYADNFTEEKLKEKIRYARRYKKLFQIYDSLGNLVYKGRDIVEAHNVTGKCIRTLYLIMETGKKTGEYYGNYITEAI